jgi:hypothetical protein
MKANHRANISRGVSISLRSNWQQVKPCPKCGKRVYGNYAGDICRKCLGHKPKFS